MTETEAISPRRYFIWLAVLTLFGACLRMYLLSETQPTGDEFYTIEEAFDYLQRGHFGLVEWHHPKLRNILMFFSIQSLGLNLWGYRFVSLLAGVLTVPLTGLVARRLTGSRAAAQLATLFMAVDTLHIMFSRQSIQEEYVPFFSLLGIYLALRYRDHRKGTFLIVAGLMYGLGLASKWNVAAPMVLSLGFIAWQQLREEGTAGREKAAELCFAVAALVVLPVTVYILSYYPWFLQRGYDLGAWVSLQKLMFAENLVHQGANPAFAQVQDHNPLHWFIRPSGFADFMMNDGRPTIVLAISNPAVWLLTLPATGYLMYHWRRLGLQEIFLLALFWSSYLPFALSRRVTELNSALAVTPFAFMVVAAVVVTLLKEKAYGKRVLCAYVGLVLITALPLYVLVIGQGFGSFMQPVLELFRPMDER